MDQQNQIQTWLETAVGGIRFKPDRVEAERELRGHIEDKMADPEEIGKELTIHMN